MSTRKKYKDPKAAREAKNYAHPVPSREVVIELLSDRDEPLSSEKLLSALGVTSENDIESMSRRLRAMERDGQILKNRRGRYGLISKMNMISGTVTGHADGFGFLIPDEGGEDLFLSPKQMRKVFHGDRAIGCVTGIDKRGRREGSLVEIIERRHHSIVGKFIFDSNVGFVIPDDKRLSQDILIPADKVGTAKPGQIVTAKIIKQPDQRSQPIGEIIEVLGDHMAPGMEIEMAVRKYELPYTWPDAVENEANQFSVDVPASASNNRIDLRKTPLVTIDGEDARDFDDAVFCERKGKDWRLLVAIADVSSYVKPNSNLDIEAYSRGTSVYFPNRVIPMLPEVLSNGLCSLKPDVDRLCMVCEMNISAAGKITSYKFYEAVMRSHGRLTYNEVAAMLVDGDAGLRKKYNELIPDLENLFNLYKTLHKARAKRGAIDFDVPETRIFYDDSGRIDKIAATERNDAHRLIEECMLVANVCAADCLENASIPAPYRIHAGPTEDKLSALREFLFELGLSLSGGDKPQAHDYADVLDNVKGKPEARLVQTVMLRSLSQAVYSPENIGHFGLAFSHYAHFTSPIRRYPDLMVHRRLKESINNKKKFSRQESHERLERVTARSEHCSMAERRADEASRDVIKWLKTEYMMDKVGEEYVGIISGVTNFGLFVELKDIFVEGLVHITALGNDYYNFDPVKHRLMGERTKQTFGLGDMVTVQVARVDLDEARIDFELKGVEPKTSGQRRTGAKKKGRPEKKTSSKSNGTRKSKKKKKKLRKKKSKNKSRSRH
jgi:ribonuclease R